MKTVRYLSVLLILCITFQLGFAVIENPQSQIEASEKLTGITEEEKEIVEALFVLSSEIEWLNEQLKAIEIEIDTVVNQIAEKEDLISNQERVYTALIDDLSVLLLNQQKAGAASRLEIILKSTSLSDLIKRMNLLRDISKYSNTLILETEAVQLDLETQQAVLKELKASLDQQKVTWELKVGEANVAKSDLESYLESLATEKAHYTSYLETVESQWNQLKPLFSETIKSFTKIIEKGDLPPEIVEINLSLFNTRRTLRQDAFNDALRNRNDLPELEFVFLEDRVQIHFPSFNVKLEGTFELVEPQIFKFVVKGGAFYNLPMSESALADLFSQGEMIFDLKSMLGKNTIKSIQIRETYIDLQIAINLF